MTTGARSRVEPRPDPAADAPLALQQESFWQLHRLLKARGGLAYNVRCDIYIHKTVAPGAVEAAVDDLARRHQSLRTTFRADGVRGRQVGTDRAPALRVVDVSDHDDPRAEAERIATADGKTVFDLEGGPPWSAVYMRLDDGTSRLVFTLHHIIFDGWSGSILEREVAELVAAHDEGRPPQLPELPVQYPDFASWQERHVRGALLRHQLRYWTDRLADVPLSLGGDPGYKPVLEPEGSTRRFTIDAGGAAALSRSCRKLRTTDFVGLLTAFQCALRRSSGVDDVVVSSAALGRVRPELMDVIGCFYNSVLLRFGPAGSTLSSEVAATRKIVSDALDHQDVPIDMLMRILWLAELRRGNTRGPHVEASFQHSETAAPPVDWIVPVADFPRINHVTAGLRLHTLRMPDGSIACDLSFTEDRHPAETADAVVADFMDLVGAVAKGADAAPRRGRTFAPPGRMPFRGLWLDREAVESALATDPALADVAVGTTGHRDADLVAWVVVVPGEEPPGPDEVRKLLTDGGQWFGVRPTVVAVDEIVRRADGTPDPAMGAPGEREPEPPKPPTSDVERRLAAVFERVTGTMPENVHDHLFELGGDLSCLKAVIDAAEQDGIRIPSWSAADVSVAGLAALAQ